MKFKLLISGIVFLSTVLSNYSFGQNTNKKTIFSYFKPPQGYERIHYNNSGFAAWIRNLPLKSMHSDVLDYRGRIFKNKTDTTIAAVIDWKIAGRKLDQCMDILVRFYAEYLWQNSQQKKLNLPLPGNQSIKWLRWEQGFRPKFKGVSFELLKTNNYNPSKNNFNKYLNLVFAESHTQQFYYFYPQINKKNVKVGDFIIKKGWNGHAVMIVDLAKNSNGDFMALIGQGDTPACEFYILNYKKNNPWVPLDFNKDYISLPIKKKMTWDGLRRFE